MTQVLEGLTAELFNAAVPSVVQERYNEAAKAYVLKASDLRSWATVMIKYPTVTAAGQLKVRVSLAIKGANDKWSNIETGLTSVKTLLEAGFLSLEEATTVLEWVEENATLQGNVHARLRLLPKGNDSYMAFSLRVNRKPGEAGQVGELAKNYVAINQLMLNGLTLEREAAIVAAFEGLDLPVPTKIKLIKEVSIQEIEAEAVGYKTVVDDEEVYQVKPNSKKAEMAAAVNF